MFKLGIITDEITQDLEAACEEARRKKHLCDV